MLPRQKIIPPIALPIIFFGLAVCIGALLLHQPASFQKGSHLSWSDAFFTATSAVCVTGLSVVSTGSFFTKFGQNVILALIQLGGLGIMTFTSLTFYMFRHRVSLPDRIAVGHTILHDQSFDMAKVLKSLFLWTFLIETLGALFIFSFAADHFTVYSAFFHAISAFCNAGFSLEDQSLVALKGNWGVNAIFMILIILGGLGFSVLVELQNFVASRIRRKSPRHHQHLSWYTTTVIKTSFLLIVVGAAALFLAEYTVNNPNIALHESALTALFQSVTCRTAGFNTLNIGNMTNVSLLIMLVLMLIGGAPGSCAGGIKVTTFRVLWAFVAAQFRGKQQVVINKFAVEGEAVSKALILIVFAAVIVFSSTLVLMITEGGDIPHPQARGLFMEVLFEVISAFGTVGLSTGLTIKLSMVGKWLITALMFIGRLGPLVLLAAIQKFRKKILYQWPKENMLIG